MFLVRPRELDVAKELVARHTESPSYMIFLCVLSVERIAIGRRNGLTHGTLLGWIREHSVATTGLELSFLDSDICDGYIEFEDDGTHAMRTMSGKLPPSNVATEIERLLETGAST